MIKKTRLSFLEDEVRLLVQYFGVDKVRTALSKVSEGSVEAPEHQSGRQPADAEFQAKPTIAIVLDQLRKNDEEKHRILTNFYTQLKEKKVLPESQDIRYFAQVIGLKEIAGKSRKDMIPKLMRFLVEQPTGRLQVDIEKAANISEQQRQQGFSILTDKLLGNK
jgi:hypothetical protein